VAPATRIRFCHVQNSFVRPVPLVCLLVAQCAIVRRVCSRSRAASCGKERQNAGRTRFVVAKGAPATPAMECAASQAKLSKPRVEIVHATRMPARTGAGSWFGVSRVKPVHGSACRRGIEGGSGRTAGREVRRPCRRTACASVWIWGYREPFAPCPATVGRREGGMQRFIHVRQCVAVVVGANAMSRPKARSQVRQGMPRRPTGTSHRAAFKRSKPAVRPTSRPRLA